MRESPEREDQFDTLHILFFLWKWKWVLLITAVVGLALGGLGIVVQTPQYESYTILFPSNTTSADKLLQEQQFGYDIHAERLIQILDSDVIRDSLIQKFDLIAHYGIDSTEIDWKDSFSRTYHDRISFQKTIFTSIVIRVRDTDPQLAADIANEIARLVDIVRWNMFKENTRRALEVLNKDYQDKLTMVSALRDSIVNYRTGQQTDQGSSQLKRIRLRQNKISKIESELSGIRLELGIYDYTNQLDILNEQIAAANSSLQKEEGRLNILEAEKNLPDSTLTRVRARAAGARNQLKSFEAERARLVKVGDRYANLENQLEQENQLLAVHQKEYEKLLLNPLDMEEDPTLFQLKNSYQFQSNLLNELQLKYQQALVRTQEPLPATYLVSKAEPSYKKVSPNVPVLLALGLLLPVIFMVVFLLFWEKIQVFRTQIKNMK